MPPRRSTQAYYEAAFRRDVSATARLPEWALARLYEQLASGAALRATVREYAALAPLIGFMVETGGKNFPPSLRAIGGDP